MSEIPHEAIEALATELSAFAADQEDSQVYVDVAGDMLREVEKVWPHDPPGHDPHSTTAASTSLSYQPAVPPRRTFGFGPAVVKS